MLYVWLTERSAGLGTFHIIGAFQLVAEYIEKAAISIGVAFWLVVFLYKKSTMEKGANSFNKYTAYNRSRTEQS